MAGWRRSACGALVLMMLAALMIPASAQNRRVRVAAACQSGLFEVDAYGNYGGYTYEYMHLISQLNNWDVEYVVFDSPDINQNVQDAMDAVVDGTADIVGAMTYHETLEERYEYPQHGYGLAYTALSTLSANRSINKLYLYEGHVLRLAVKETAEIRNQKAITYLDTAGISYQLVEFKTEDQAYQALERGEADVVVQSSVDFKPGLKAVAEFSPQIFYFVTTRGNTALAAELDDALGMIQEYYPDFRKTQQEAAFSDHTKVFEPLKMDRAYLESLGELRVLCQPDAGPYAFLDSEGEVRGVGISLLRDFCETVGVTLRCEVYNGEPLEEGLISQYDCIVGDIAETASQVSQRMITTRPYLESAVVWFYRPDGGLGRQDKKVALVQGTEHEENDIDGEIYYYDNVEQCMAAVERGEADYGCGDSRAVQFYSARNSWPMDSVQISGWNNQAYLAVVTTDGLQLLALMNDYIKTLDESKLYQWTMEAGYAPQADEGISDLFRQHPVVVTAVCSLLIFGMLALLAMTRIYHRIKRQNQQLEKANNAKSEFLSRMSHDIRTPMNAIIGMTDIAKNSTRDEEMLGYLDKIDSSSHFLLSLINDVLDLSKIESQQFQLIPETTKLEDFDEGINTIIRPLMDEKHIHFIYDMHCGLTCISVDSLRYCQIFFNLLSNAAKFTPEGGQVEFTAEFLRQEGQRHWVRHIVRDTGCGMSPELMKEVFEPFVQGGGRLSGDWKGTGLGLAIVKRLVDAMGGEISIRSELGKGTEVTVDMPLLPVEWQDLPPGPAPTNWNVLKGRRVLVVEDNQINTEVAVRLLERMDMICETAGNGAEALEKFGASPENWYDAVAMDVRMPEMDGLEATRRLRRLPRRDAPIIPVIAMTADAFQQDMDRTAEAGMTAHVSKPVEPTLLYDTLAREMTRYWERRGENASDP